jgi:hypothetical protein
MLFNICRCVLRLVQARLQQRQHRRRNAGDGLVAMVFQRIAVGVVGVYRAALATLVALAAVIAQRSQRGAAENRFTAVRSADLFQLPHAKSTNSQITQPRNRDGQSTKRGVGNTPRCSQPGLANFVTYVWPDPPATYRWASPAWILSGTTAMLGAQLLHCYLRNHIACRSRRSSRD